MPMPTAQKVEKNLLSYGKRLLWGIPFLLVAVGHKWIAEFLQDMMPQSLAQLSAWLILGIVLVTSLLLFYFYHYHVTKKSLLKVKPDYFAEQEKDRLWEQVTHDRAREKNKT